jgi:methylmalonyl-CoA/ethylmalonyl-CoA epimerase
VEAASLRVGADRIELLQASSAETPVGRFVANRGPGLHHVAFEVDDLPAELARLAASGDRLIDEQPRRGLNGLRVAFVHPEATGGVLAELVDHGAV